MPTRLRTIRKREKFNPNIHIDRRKEKSPSPADRKWKIVQGIAPVNASEVLVKASPIDSHFQGHHEGYETLSNEIRKLLKLREDEFMVRGDKVDFVRIGKTFFAKASAKVSSAPWNPNSQFFEIKNPEIIAKLKAIEKDIGISERIRKTGKARRAK
ncbi:MAG: hypothetical protein Q7S21_05260 [archaeon]|nr:hypothetical protein [archaeon]